MPWSDEEEAEVTKLCSVTLDSKHMHIWVEISRACGINPDYRVSAGNIFGSESIWVDTAENALRALNQLQEAARDDKKITHKDIPGFVRQEYREPEKPEKEEDAVHAGV